MATSTRFAPDELGAIRKAKIFGVRAGATHRPTGVWVVVVDDRVFVRSWNDKPTGWFRAFRAEPEGSVTVGKTAIPVRARHVRSVEMRQAVTRALAEKYDSRANERWVRGFAEAGREANTLELLAR